MLRYVIIILFILFILESCNYENSNNITANKSLHVNDDSVKYASEVIKFMRQFMENQVYEDSIIISDEPRIIDSSFCHNFLLYDSAFFSAEEKVFIINQLRQSVINKWTNELIKKVRIISHDTINNALKDFLNGWDYFHEHIGNGYHTCSSPIFLRNFTYCLFYFDTHCGYLCGGGQVRLFKKEGQTWKEVESFCNWIS